MRCACAFRESGEMFQTFALFRPKNALAVGGARSVTVGWFRASAMQDGFGQADFGYRHAVRPMRSGGDPVDDHRIAAWL